MNPELYNKHGRRVVVDILDFADSSRHEWVYFKASEAKPSAVAVVALTEDNKIILSKQYRHPMGKIIYDLPAGGMHEAETPMKAALRKLEEETGYSADKLEWIGRFSWALGNVVGKDEIVNIDLVDFNKFTSKVLKGEYVDSALVIATLLISARRLLH